MLAAFTSGPTLWYANRATGVVLVVLLTASTALGVSSTARAGSVRWPRFATQACTATCRYCRP
jgi:succinate dehydrogenase hydrophobic anchor subunit